MRRLASFVVVAVLVGGAFAAGYVTRERAKVEDRRALAQAPQASPPASPRSSPPSGGQGKSRSGSAKNLIFAVVDGVQGNRVTVTVRDVRGGAVQQGSTVTVEIGSDVEITKQITVADLRKGDVLAIRGTMEGRRLVPDGIRVERQ
jgi:hypothetical protein